MTHWALIASVALLVGNAFFVGAEFALIAARRTQIEPLARAGSRPARVVLNAMNQIPIMIAGAQLGVTACSLGLGALAEPGIAKLLIPTLTACGIGHGLVHAIAVVIALGIVVFFHTVLGEMVPKNIALAGPDKAVLWLGPAMWAFALATKPLLIVLRWISQRILLMINIPPTDAVRTAYTATELGSIISQSRTEGLIDATRHQQLAGVLSLNQLTIKTVLVPWKKVDTVENLITPAALEKLAIARRRSRFPVIDHQTRRVLGFVHVKDALNSTSRDRQSPLKPESIRRLTSVDADTSLAEVLVIMRRERSHMTLVTCEEHYLGVATLDDILNAVVGTKSIT